MGQLISFSIISECLDFLKLIKFLIKLETLTYAKYPYKCCSNVSLLMKYLLHLMQLGLVLFSWRCLLCLNSEALCLNEMSHKLQRKFRSVEWVVRCCSSPVSWANVYKIFVIMIMNYFKRLPAITLLQTSQVNRWEFVWLMTWRVNERYKVKTVSGQWTHLYWIGLSLWSDLKCCIRMRLLPNLLLQT